MTTANTAQPSGEVVLYRTDDGKTRLEVKFQGESVWLTQKQMAELFQKDVRTVNEHIRNVYEEGELTQEPTLRNFRIVQTEGKRQVERDVAHYGLDVIISVGYRVNSKRGTQFRIWATRTLRDHLVQGYTLNERRLRNIFVYVPWGREATVAKNAAVVADGVFHQLLSDKLSAIIEGLLACVRSAGRNENLAA